MFVDFYPTVFDAVALHEFVMQRTASPPAALRDEGALDSALKRPLMAAHYEDANLSRQAVLLMVGIALAHPFVDGNKRAALIVGDTFLDENGWSFIGDYLELARQIEAILMRDDALDAAMDRFVAWLDPLLVPAHPTSGTHSRRDR